MTPKEQYALLMKLADLLAEDTTQPICRAHAVSGAACDILNMGEALEAARLLCANLEAGHDGHMALVQNFRKLDANNT